MHRDSVSRRQFLTASAVVTTGLLAGCGTPVRRVDPVGVIDTHTHFYDPTRPGGVPWPPENDSVLYRPVYPDELQKLTRRHGVAGTVVIEASPWLDDNTWILDLAEKNDFILGFVGNVKPGRVEFARELKRFTVNPVFRGIRMGAWDKGQALSDPAVLHDLRILAEGDLSLDLLINPNQLGLAADLAKTIPHLRIVIDHCANVAVDGHAPPLEWLKGLAACALHRNIFMKVSGLVEGTGRGDGKAPVELAFHRPVLDAVWNAFGEDRVLFGSNWPVSSRFATYDKVFNLVAEYFHGKGEGAAGKYFTRNAVKVYKIAAR